MFRAAREPDLPVIVAMLADDEFGGQRELLYHPLPEAYRAAFAEIDADPNQLLVVAEADGRVVGTLQLSFLRHLTFAGGLRAQVEAVRVSRELRGTGLGHRMMRWAIELARERGAHVVQLTTNAEREAARRFYDSLGFVASHHGMKLDLTATG